MYGRHWARKCWSKDESKVSNSANVCTFECSTTILPVVEDLKVSMDIVSFCLESRERSSYTVEIL